MLQDLKFSETIVGFTENISYSSGEGDYRLYHKGKEGSFEFKLIHFTGYDLWKDGKSYPEDFDLNSTTRCSVLAFGRGFFDGTRHLYFTSDADECSGYWFYPDLSVLKFLADKLIELEIKYECDRK